MIRRSTLALREMLVPPAVLAFLSVLLLLAVNRVRAAVAETQARSHFAHNISAQRLPETSQAARERRLP